MNLSSVLNGPPSGSPFILATSMTRVAHYEGCPNNEGLAQQTCMLCRPSHAWHPLYISQSSTPNAYTSHACACVHTMFSRYTPYPQVHAKICPVVNVVRFAAPQPPAPQYYRRAHCRSIPLGAELFHAACLAGSLTTSPASGRVSDTGAGARQTHRAARPSFQGIGTIGCLEGACSCDPTASAWYTCRIVP